VIRQLQLCIICFWRFDQKSTSVDFCSNLRQLDLSENTTVSDAAVLEMVTSRRFGILECPLTFSADGLERFQAAVKLARKR
jgi:hypothetical protein